MKKSVWIIVILVVLLAFGAYLGFSLNTQIGSVKDELNATKDVLHDTDEQLVAAQAALTDVQKALDQKTTDLSDQAKQFELISTDKAKSDAELASLTTENAALESQLADAQEQLQSANAAYDKAKSDLTENALLLDEATRAAQDKDDELAEVMRQRLAAASEISGLKAEKDILQAQRNEAERKNADLEKMLEEVEAERDALLAK